MGLQFFCARSLAFVICAAVLVIGTTRPAGAQTVDDSTYVSVGAFGDIKRFSGDPESNVLDGQAFGGAVALGTTLATRWDLEVGVEISRLTTDRQPYPVTVRRSTVILQSRIRNRPVSVTTLLRVRMARRGRLQIGFLGGLSVLRLQREFDTEAPPGTQDLLIPRPHESVDYGMAPTLGVDARVAITAHLSIVPAIQVSTFALQSVSGVLLRPRIAARWTF